MAYYAAFKEARAEGKSLLDIPRTGDRPAPIYTTASYRPCTAHARLIHDEYTLGDKLGSGAFSVVKKGVRKATGEVVAVKIVKRGGLSKVEAENLSREIAIMREIRHPHVLGLLDVFDTEAEEVYLVTEFVSGGELFDRIQAKTVYTEAEARVLVHLLLSTLDHLHTRGVVHRDIKPENILMTDADSDTHIKLIDFGFAKHVVDLKGDRTLCGTPDYIAPEILKREPYGAVVDVWSCGVIVYILLGGYPPFYDDTKKGLYRKIMQGEYAFDEAFWGPVSDSAKDLVRRMLTVDPTQRPSARELLRHPWVTATKGEDDDFSLDDTVKALRRWTAKRRLKRNVAAVIAVNKFSSLGGLRSIASVAAASKAAAKQEQGRAQALADAGASGGERRSVAASGGGMVGSTAGAGAPSREAVLGTSLDGAEPPLTGLALVGPLDGPGAPPSDPQRLPTERQASALAGPEDDSALAMLERSIAVAALVREQAGATATAGGLGGGGSGGGGAGNGAGRGLVGAAGALDAKAFVSDMLAASRRGDASAVAKLVSLGADPSLGDTVSGQAPVHACCGAGHAGCFLALLKLGADKKAVDAEGRNAMHYAARADMQVRTGRVHTGWVRG